MALRFWNIALAFVALAFVGSGPARAAASTVDIDAFIRKDHFHDIKLSPKGDYYAATLPLEDQTGLVIIRRADNVMTGSFRLGRNTHVADFWWVNPQRVLISVAEKLGALDQPRLTGELYGIDADGNQAGLLVGQRVRGAGPGTRIQPRAVEAVAAFLVDPLPDDHKHVVISVQPFTTDPLTRAERMDVYSGRRTPLARAPVRNADFLTDHAGQVRFASGFGTDNVARLYHRAGSGAEWELVNDASTSQRVEWPIGFSADGKTAYLVTEQPDGPNAIVAYDPAARTRTPVLRDASVDPDRILYRNGGRTPVGATFMDGKPRMAFFDDALPEARLHRGLEAAFGADWPTITSRTTDGSLALVLASSDRNPGDYYLVDTDTRKATHLLSRRAWLDPEQMAHREPIRFTARDGLVLHGYLTRPKDADGKGLPLVVMPHGGPFGVRDGWGFDDDAQMLAQAGYAVLQVNFRGSGGYGQAFTRAGKRQWGLAMQDDLTDATHWAIREGTADPSRICLHGASYGGYAALMGVAKEPDLYRCAVGYIGVYDLPTLHTHGDIQRWGSGESFVNEWIGERSALAAVSPTRLAERIKAPVFLAAGGEDERAPIKHSRMMERALRDAGVPVETLYFETEGHGFYLEANRRAYYTRLLGFLSCHLGGRVASNKESVPRSHCVDAARTISGESL